MESEMITEQGWKCDYCDGDNGEFYTETGNHVGCQDLATFKTRLEKAEAFIREIFELSDWPEGGDIDGFELQDAAVKHGFLIPETRMEPCGEGCNCNTYYSSDEWEGGVTCYRISAELMKAKKK
jgi:hypothetical protein